MTFSEVNGLDVSIGESYLEERVVADPYRKNQKILNAGKNYCNYPKI